MIFRRLKNLWDLSAYRMQDKETHLPNIFSTEKTLVKDFPTIQKKLATIIEDKYDPFPEQEEEKKDEAIDS